MYAAMCYYVLPIGQRICAHPGQWWAACATLCYPALSCILANLCNRVLLSATNCVHRRTLDSGGQRVQPDDCIFLEPRAERTDLADCGRFPQISNFSGADRRKQNICRRDFAEEERHLPHFKYLICCFSRCSHFQHWFKVKAYSK